MIELRGNFAEKRCDRIEKDSVSEVLTWRGLSCLCTSVDVGLVVSGVVLVVLVAKHTLTPLF